MRCTHVNELEHIMQAVSLARRKTPSSVRWQPPAFGTPCAKWTHSSFTTLKDYLGDPTFPILPKAVWLIRDTMPISFNGIGMQALAIASCEKTSMDGSDIAATSVRVLWPGDGRSMVGIAGQAQSVLLP